MTSILSSALIGHTGLVGSTLHRDMKFDAAVNSKTIASIENSSFDLVVCAGVYSRKWWADQNAAEDEAQIAKLISSLETIRAREFILISTIDVYPQSNYNHWADEDEILDVSAHFKPYGRNRLALEKWVLDNFPLARIVRLPAVFGEGLKKNALFDLLNARKFLLPSETPPKLNPASAFQWYSLRWLATHLKHVHEKDIQVMNLFPEPLSMGDIHTAFFPTVRFDPENASLIQYNINTKRVLPYGYIASHMEVLGEMAKFIIAERSKCLP